jgi:hypothetical protein
MVDGWAQPNLALSWLHHYYHFMTFVDKSPYHFLVSRFVDLQMKSSQSEQTKDADSEFQLLTKKMIIIVNNSKI